MSFKTENDPECKSRTVCFGRPFCFIFTLTGIGYRVLRQIRRKQAALSIRCPAGGQARGGAPPCRFFTPPGRQTVSACAYTPLRPCFQPFPAAPPVFFARPRAVCCCIQRPGETAWEPVSAHLCAPDVPHRPRPYRPRFCTSASMRCFQSAPRVPDARTLPTASLMTA